MDTTAAVQLLPIAAFAVLLSMALWRGVALHRRGVTVVLRDHARPWRDAIRGAMVLGCFLLWGYALLANAWTALPSVAPPSLDLLLLTSSWARAVGAAGFCASVVLYALALRAFGQSWRIGLDVDAHGALVTRGVFAAARNPIYVAIDLHVLGAFAWSGRLFFLVAAVFTCAVLHLVARTEGNFLADTYGDAYHAYRRRVGRYSPWF